LLKPFSETHLLAAIKTALQNWSLHKQSLGNVPSCLVLDLSLPGLNGLDLRKHLAAEHIDMPIIFITAYGDVPKSVQAMKAGALEVLTKPLDNNALISAIRNALERSRLPSPNTRRCRNSAPGTHRLLPVMEKMKADSLATLVKLAAMLGVPRQSSALVPRQPS
jgi:DNA-binding NtrC family response regulator